MRKPVFVVYAAVLLAMLFWGMSFTWYKNSFAFFRPVTVILFRLVISGFILLVFGILAGRLQKIRRRDIPGVLILSLFNPFAYFLCESHGMTFVSPALGSIIISTIPLVVPIAGYFFLGERISFLNKLGLTVSFAGVVIFITASEGGFGATLPGVFLMFGAVISAVGFAILIKKLSADYSPLTLTTWHNTIGIFLFLPVFLFVDYEYVRGMAIPVRAFLPLLYLAIFGSSLAFIFFSFGIKKLGTTRANIFTNLIPIVAALYSYFFLGEKMPAAKIMAIFVVLAGLFMSQMKTTGFGRIIRFKNQVKKKRLS